MSIPLSFSRGDKGPRGGGGFAMAAMPIEEKRMLARSLLNEFGVTAVTERGRELIHSCCLPFGGHAHGDASPSASLNYEKLTYNCLGCGNSGGLLWFIGVCRGEDTDQSRAWLKDQLGHDDSSAEGVAKLLAFIEAIYNPEITEAQATIPKMSAHTLTPWLKLHPWVTEVRRVHPEVAMAFKVGYGVFRVPLGDDVWVQSHRIVLPHFWRGELVGWQTRRLTDDATPKYLSSADFPKDLTIYNYRPRQNVVVVESMLSVLARNHMDPHIEATFGAKVTDRQLELLADHRTVTLWFDSDKAGWGATHRVARQLERYCPVFVVNNPYSADVGDIDDATYQELLDQKVPYAMWQEPTNLIPWEPKS